MASRARFGCQSCTNSPACTFMKCDKRLIIVKILTIVLIVITIKIIVVISITILIIIMKIIVNNYNNSFYY